LNRRIYVILAVIITIGIVAASYPHLIPSPKTVKEDFENGLGVWVVEADVPEDPNNPGHPVEWNITQATDVAHSGRYSLKFFIDGRQDDGAIWVERKIGLNKNKQIQIKVSFEFYSGSESFVTIAGVCAYAGIRNLEVEDDFTVIGQASEVEGWKKYTYTAAINTASNEEVWVAVGITVRWETYMTYYIDDVEIEIQ